MSPIEDLQGRDLEWISDFVMQQVAFMLRPLMDHLDQTDLSVDYAQRSVQQLAADVSEVRGDLDRTNRYLASLRQGLGVQNESKCMLERGMESTMRSVKRLDEQVGTLLGSSRSAEDEIRSLSSDVRSCVTKNVDLSRRLSESAAGLDDIRGAVERSCTDVQTLKSEVEVWSSEVREIRRGQANWPKKSTLAQPGDSMEYSTCSRSGSRSALWNNPAEAQESTTGTSKPGEDLCQSARLPLLAKQPGGGSRPPPSALSSGPRLRFPETLAKPPSRG